MSALSQIIYSRATAQPHADFLALIPIVERQVRGAFRDRNTTDREEAVAEAVAAAFLSYLGLKRRGKDPVRDFPVKMAIFAALHVKSDRHVGGQATSKDVLSRLAQKKRGFVVQRLPSSPRTAYENLYGDPDGQQKQDAFEERLQDPSNGSIPDLVAFRIDFRDFVRTLSPRDQKLTENLALGYSGNAVAAMFNITPGRLSQLRGQWRREWLNFQGEPS